MPPKLALLVCVAFVLFLLRLDRKQHPEASYALWVPTIWMLLGSCKPLGVWFGSGATSMVEGSAIDRNTLIILACGGAIILARRSFIWPKLMKENIWVILFLSYMFISISWSDMPYVSFKRWSRQLIVLMMALSVASERDAGEGLKTLLRRTVYVLMPFSFLLINYYPHLGRSYGRWSGELMWIGVSSQKNGLAQLSLMTIFFLVWTFIRRARGQDVPVVWYQRYIEYFLLGLAILLFTGPNHTITYSATSTVSLAVGLCALAYLLWARTPERTLRAGTLMLIATVIIAYGTITPFVGKLSLVDISSTLDRDETLTGRSMIWAYLVPYAKKRPILGYGFGGFWTESIRENTSSNGHNGYLDTILDIGFLGLIVSSGYLLSCCRRFRQMLDGDFYWGAFGICLLLMALVINIAESSVVGFGGGMSKIILILAVGWKQIGKGLDKRI